MDDTKNTGTHLNEPSRWMMEKYCATHQQGRAVYQQIKSILAENIKVQLNFQNTKFYSPSFFVGLLGEASIHELQNMKAVSMADIEPGRDMMYAVIREVVDGNRIFDSLYKVVTVGAYTYPVLLEKGGLYNVFMSDHVAQVENKYPCTIIEQEEYDALIWACVEKREALDKDRASTSNPLQCPRCYKKFDSITGFRRHVRRCQV